MKEKIYTIPINEAFEQEGFCPFCYIYKKLEAEAVDYTLGPAMMESDFRNFTNERGFCQKHIRDLHGKRNALSFALVAETHMAVWKSVLQEAIVPEKKSFFKKEKSKKAVYAEKFKKLSGSCAICEKVEKTLSDYIETFIFMLKTEDDFLDRVLASDGFCMEHFSLISQKASDQLSDSDYEKYFVPIINKQMERLEKYHSDLKIFEASFDYRNAGKPLEVSKDILLKVGYLLNGEFEPNV